MHKFRSKTFSKTKTWALVNLLYDKLWRRYKFI